MSRGSRDQRPLPRDPQQVVVDGFTHGGEGVARIEGKAVFVPGGLPGETVVVRVDDDRASWARAELLEVVEASPDRVEPPCPYVPDCGGCDLQHVSPDAQRALKTRVVREQLVRLGRVSEPPVLACRPVGPDTGYRAQARMHADADGHLGFHRAGSSEVVAIEHCLVLTEAAQALRDLLGDETGAEEVRLRRFTPGGDGSVVLTPGPGPLELPGGDFDILLAQPDASTVAMRGDGRIQVEADGLTFTVPALSFFQPGVGAAEALLREVVAAAGPIEGALTWDLYAGVGLLSLGLARAGAEVIAVEGDAQAAEAARANAEANALPLTVVAEPVGTFARHAGRGPGATDQATARATAEPPDIVVLDPPRTGAGRDVIAALSALHPAAIVYVACDVAALSRDTRHLADAGYELRRAAPLDLFPMTHHVEVVATFTQASPAA
ncbi:MAG: class I SAM-dependent RNA methyltransferase [Nitriliruptoraceae bacterium]